MPYLLLIYIRKLKSQKNKLATIKYFDYYVLKVKLDDPKVIKAMIDIYIRNYRLYIYD